MKKSKDGLGPGKDGEDTVTLRRRDALVMPQPTKPPSSLVSPYSFMRRSCTFVAESSLGLRKSGSRTSFTGNSSSIHPASTRTPLRGQPAPAANKVVKDRKNLAMQVRQKKDMLEESTNGRSCVDGRVDESVSGGGRMSRLVGGLRAWSSTEDVRQSVMGAIGRTVSVIKQKPVSRKVKQAFGRPDPTIPETSKSNLTKPETSRHITPDSTKYKPNKSHITKNTPNKTQPSKVPASKKTLEKQLSERVQPGKPQSTKFQFGRTSASRCKSTPTPVTTPAHHTPTTTAAHHKSQDPKWFRHIQEAQEAYTARDGRNRRSHPQTPLQDPDDQPSSTTDPLRDVDDNVDVDGGDPADGTNDNSVDSKTHQGASKSAEQICKSEEPSSTPTTTPAAQPPASPDTLTKKTEHLRRKDLKIRQALEEKQHIIADILNIPHEHFENVVDMAGEPTVGNKEPRELVLAAMFQAKCLQETLNEALNISEGDIVAARANNDSANKATSLPLYQAPMTKLLTISTVLTQQLSSLLNLVSDRDDERERMRKELVASRERIHDLHMRQNSVSNQTSSTTTPSQPTSATTPVVLAGVIPPTATSPHSSRPSSFVSVASSAADHSDTPDHHDTDEDAGSEVPKLNSSHPEECEDSKEDSVPETFEDAVSGSEPTETKSGEVEGSTQGQESSDDGRGCESSTDTITT